MKLVFFDDFRLGVVKDNSSVVDISDAVGGITHTSPQELMSKLIEAFSEYRGRIESAVGQASGTPLDKVRLRSPIPRPYNLVCMAVNYMEDGTRDEPAPINAFQKSPNAVIGNGDTMVLPDVPATIFEGEAEIALVISKRASQVRAEDAHDYIFGYTNFIDMSARGLLPPGNTFYQMKSRDTFAPMGPWIVTADEIADPQKLQVKLSVNGELKQNFNTDDMAHKIARCIEWVTSIHPLDAGDVVATGTNHRGLSAIPDGDTIDLDIEGIGNLRINARDDLKRTWPRDTRLDRTNRGLEGAAAQSTGKYAKV